METSSPYFIAITFNHAFAKRRMQKSACKQLAVKLATLILNVQLYKQDSMWSCTGVLYNACMHRMAQYCYAIVRAYRHVRYTQLLA